MNNYVKKTSTALVIGILLSFPVIFYWEIRDRAAIGLLVFLLTGLVNIFFSFFEKNHG